MNTGRIENWAGNIADIGPIYPFVGTEFFLFLIGLVFWIAWHVLQFRVESREFKEDVARVGNPEGMKKALDRNGD
ncbi:MAG TPA: hypothetical protein VF460_06220 [Burkholderiales bacterium]